MEQFSPSVARGRHVGQGMDAGRGPRRLVEQGQRAREIQIGIGRNQAGDIQTLQRFGHQNGAGFGVFDLGRVLGIGQKRELSGGGVFHPGHAVDLQFAIARQAAPQRIGNFTEFHKTGNHQRTKCHPALSAYRNHHQTPVPRTLRCQALSMSLSATRFDIHAQFAARGVVHHLPHRHRPAGPSAACPPSRRIVTAVLRRTAEGQGDGGPPRSHPPQPVAVSGPVRRKFRASESLQQRFRRRTPQVVDHHVETRAPAASRKAATSSSCGTIQRYRRIRPHLPSVLSSTLAISSRSDHASRSHQLWRSDGQPDRSHPSRPESGRFRRASVWRGAGGKATPRHPDWVSRRPSWSSTPSGTREALRPPHHRAFGHRAITAAVDRRRTPACRPPVAPMPSAPHTTGSSRGLA